MKNKILFAFLGFILGNLFLGTLIYGVVEYQNLKTPKTPFITAKNEITFEEAIGLIKRKEINFVNIKDEKVDFYRRGGLAYSDRLNEAQLKQVWDRLADSELTINVEPKSVNIPLAFDIFPILFLLFLISPPIIVILLLVIIRKMNKQKSLD